MRNMSSLSQKWLHTVNEVQLTYHMLEKTNDPAMKKNLINYFLDLFKGKMFRQTMFAEFEKIVHEKLQSEEPLTSTQFSDIYYQLNQEYYGKDIVHDDEFRFEWTRIPHFYSSFYVYQYATGYAQPMQSQKESRKKAKPLLRII
jgi:oligoendopeptidase F